MSRLRLVKRVTTGGLANITTIAAAGNAVTGRVAGTAAADATGTN